VNPPEESEGEGAAVTEMVPEKVLTGLERVRCRCRL